MTAIATVLTEESDKKPTTVQWTVGAPGKPGGPETFHFPGSKHEILHDNAKPVVPRLTTSTLSRRRDDNEHDTTDAISHNNEVKTSSPSIILNTPQIRVQDLPSVLPNNENESPVLELSPNSISPAVPRPNRVHFRSRVRITSGIHRHRNSKSFPSPKDDSDTVGFASISIPSSRSSSPSSSISAPLRTRADDEAYRPGWEPLGQRVSSVAYGAAQRRRARERKERRLKKHALESDLLPPECLDDPNEHTPLLRPFSRTSHIRRDGLHDDDDYDSEEEEEARLSREINAIFGTWPGRLLNRHWWWWQLEPVVRCSCLDDSDVEE